MFSTLARSGIFALWLVTLVVVPARADTLYVANETTNTISVIDTTTNSITATIGLGSDPAIPGTPQPNGPLNGEADHHKAFYNGHVDTHGLWLSPDGSLLLATNRVSGTVAAIDTTTRTLLGYTPVGREPHLATVRPGGKEAWVAIRGESHIDVLKLDPSLLYAPGRRRTDRMPIVDTLDTVAGPSMVSFTSDGRFAFVASGKQNRVDKFDATNRTIVASQTLPAAFTPFALVTPDDRELYMVHKGAGTLSILRTSDLSFVVQGMPIGARANHVYFIGRFAYITVGGPAATSTNPDPEGKLVIVDRSTHAIVRELTGPQFNGEPHGVWASADGRIYVGHERGNRVTVINMGNSYDAMDDVVLGTVSGAVDQLGFLKKPIDLVTYPSWTDAKRPKITGIWPCYGTSGTVAFVFGEGFVAGATQVSVGTVPAALVQVFDPTLLGFMVPAGNPIGPLTVTTFEGSATSNTNFDICGDGLYITGLWPASAKVGSFVYVFGTGYVAGDTLVAVNSVPAPLTQVIDRTLLIFMVPPGATTGKVTVTLNGPAVSTISQIDLVINP